MNHSGRARAFVMPDAENEDIRYLRLFPRWRFQLCARPSHHGTEATFGQPLQLSDL